MKDWEQTLCEATRNGDFKQVYSTIDYILTNKLATEAEEGKITMPGLSKEKRSANRGDRLDKMLLDSIRYGWLHPDCAFVYLLKEILPGTPNSTPDHQSADNDVIFAAALGGQTALVERYLALLVLRRIIFFSSRGKQKRVLSKSRKGKRRSIPDWLRHIRYFTGSFLVPVVATGVQRDPKLTRYEAWTRSASNVETERVFVSKEYTLDDLAKLAVQILVPHGRRQVPDCRYSSPYGPSLFTQPCKSVHQDGPGHKQPIHESGRDKQDVDPVPSTIREPVVPTSICSKSPVHAGEEIDEEDACSEDSFVYISKHTVTTTDWEELSDISSVATFEWA